MIDSCRNIFVLSSILLAGCVVTSARAAVITPVDSGQAVGSGFLDLSGAFDAQPAAEPVAGPTGNSGTTGGGGQPSLFAGRTGFIDFGPDYALISIEATYELVRQFGNNPGWSASTYVWSNDTELGNADDVAAPDFGFTSPTAANGNQQWLARYTGPAVAPEARFLLIDLPDTGLPGNRSLEWAFVGTVVPEPASIAIFGVGLATLLTRARR